MHRIQELKIWQKSIELSKMIYTMVEAIPNDEKYGLSQQIKRSAISIPSNIAKGAGRNSNKEFKHFLSIANGSAYELQTQLVLLSELNLISKEMTEPILNLLDEILKMNYSLQKSISGVESEY